MASLAMTAFCFRNGMARGTCKSLLGLAADLCTPIDNVIASFRQ